MSDQLSPAEIESALIGRGVPKDKARAMALREAGAPAANYVHVDLSKRLDFPIRITLPWSALCSDNFHERASIVRVRGGKIAPRKVMDTRYKMARDKTREIARKVMGDFKPLADMPLAMHVRVYLPGGSARNDAINFSKCANDALQGIVYKNDNQLHDQRWQRAGIDVDAPRAEITISPL